jgi:hypothetical protein
MTNVSIQKISLGIIGLVSATVGLLTQQQAIQLFNILNPTLGSGTGAGNVNQFFQTQATLAASTSIDYDLYAWGGALDGGGNALTMAKAKLIIVQNLGVVANPVEADVLSIGGKGTTAGWTAGFGTNTDTAKILSPAAVGGQPGTFLLVNFGAGYTVGASTTNHILTLTSGANTGVITYNIFALGSTA